jgi:hypothetical protein
MERTGMMFRFALCVLLPLAGAAFASDDIEIRMGDCNSGVHLVARDARLLDVLKRLADTLHFELQIPDTSDSIVDVNVSKQAPELVATLSPIDNLMLTQTRNPDCPGKYRVVKVWMLSKGTQASKPPAVVPSVPPPPTEAQKKLMQEGEEMYRRAHGMPPAGD